MDKKLGFFAPMWYSMENWSKMPIWPLCYYYIYPVRVTSQFKCLAIRTTTSYKVLFIESSSRVTVIESLTVPKATTLTNRIVSFEELSCLAQPDVEEFALGSIYNVFPKDFYWSVKRLPLSLLLFPDTLLVLVGKPSRGLFFVASEGSVLLRLLEHLNFTIN